MFKRRVSGVQIAIQTKQAITDEETFRLTSSMWMAWTRIHLPLLNLHPSEPFSDQCCPTGPAVRPPS